MTKRNTLILAAALFLALAAQTHAALFLSDTSIGPGDTNYDGQDIVVLGCTLKIDGSHNFSDLVIIQNGRVTHSPITTNAPGGGLNLAVSNNIVIEAGSAIDAQGLGFGSGLGAGAGASLVKSNVQYGFSYLSGGGGGYGGDGGSSFGGVPGGATYGPATAPTNAGSGGGAGLGSGGAGGGLVNLTVGGALVVDGQINANGGDGANLAAGGGSGGAIVISAPSVSGSGSISASGGMAEALDGGGGGGGRIALFFTTNDFSGSISAAGGQGAVAGGAGTVNLQAAGGGEQILVDNAGVSGANTPLTVPTGCSVTISGGAVAYLSAASVTLSNLSIASNGWLVPAPSGLTTYTLNLTVLSSATVQAGGGMRFNSANGSSGMGFGGSYNTNGALFGAGGGYGGNGGGVFNQSGGQSFGSYLTPTAAGGAGGNSGVGGGALNSGGRGGGALMLSVPGTLSLDGSINADGGSGVGDASGGGAGGSLYLIVGTLTGSGAITAIGGAAGTSEGGGGGGGRVAVYCGTNQFSGLMAAHGGPGFVNGGAGTIYLETTNSGASQTRLLLDNAGLAGAATPISGDGAQVDLTVTNSASALLLTQWTVHNLMVGSNSFILPSIQPNLLQVQNNATIAAGGGISVDGKSLSLLEGNGNGGGGLGGSGGSGSTGPGGPPDGQVVFFEAISGASGAGGLQRGGGAGGGGLSINVTHTLLLNGLISANGAAGVGGTGGGGGSGGGIYLAAGVLTGSGAISANGGAGDSLLGGGGGGGRIAISCTTNSFAGATTAYGGTGFAAGAAGTIYVVTKGSAYGQVLVDNRGLAGTNTPISNLPQCDFTVAHGAVVVASLNLGEQIRHLLITSNSFIILGPSQQPGSSRLQLAGNATIQAGGGIIVDGAGYSGGEGSYAGSTSVSNSIATGGGGGNAGFGGNSAFGAKGGGANLPLLPSGATLPGLGSGGGAGAGLEQRNLGGAGGGSLLLQAAGSLVLDGKLSANGAPGVGEGSGGGAGGGITVLALTFSGSGTISANGGAGQMPYGGGGGGGVVQTLITTSNQFAGSLSAHGGQGATAGGAGVVVEQTSRNGPVTQVIYDNGGLSGTNTPAPTIAISGQYDLTISGGAIMALYNGDNTLTGEPRNLMVASNSFVNSGGSGVVKLNLSSNLTIAPTGGVVVDGQGFTAGQGPGSGRTEAANGGGGGYGGSGGAGANRALGGSVYGSVTAPSSSGSGGGGQIVLQGRANTGGSGGGAVQITVAGTLSLGGNISANGGAGQSQGGVIFGQTQGSGGGGAGGSIWLTVGKLTGAGSISANGGAGQLPGGGGGGGGRIAVIGPSLLFTGSMSAHGGAGFANGGAGTIYTALNNQGVQSGVLVDNAGLNNGYTSLATLQSISNLTIRAGTVVTSPPKLTGNLLIGSNGFVLQTDPQPLLVSVQGNATVQAGGGILLDGMGNPQGPGAGRNVLSLEGHAVGSGGGHGGYGGTGGSGALGGNAYDQFNAPTGLGSGGGGGAGSYATNAPGGGALQMTVNGSLQMDGLISANGAEPTGEDGGGGSGGSVYLTTGVLAGAGVISANGAAGDLPGGGGGGGGRIALLFKTNRFTGSCQARGGAGFVAGGAGTVYLGPQDPGQPGASNQVIIDNGGLTGAATPLAPMPSYGLTAAGGAVMVPQSPGVEIMLNNMTLSSNAVITDLSGLGHVSIAVLGDALVETNATISVDGLGNYGSHPGPGAGTVATNSEGSGGGYGGMGGASAGGAPGGATYGSAEQPASAGSGGGVALLGNTNLSQGGGVINLAVGGTLTINGKVSANGDAGIFPGAGGGSGGSVWLTSGTLAGQGVISANGGAGQGNVGGGGGGGRIAIYSRTNAFAGAASVSGGTGFASGQSGTVNISTNGSGPRVIAQSPVVGMGPNQASLNLQWIGLGGVSYQVELSRDLIHWEPYGSPVISSNGPNVLVLPVGPDSGGFYRLVLTN